MRHINSISTHSHRHLLEFIARDFISAIGNEWSEQSLGVCEGERTRMREREMKKKTARNS